MASDELSPEALKEMLNSAFQKIQLLEVENKSLTERLATSERIRDELARSEAKLRKLAAREGQRTEILMEYRFYQQMNVMRLTQALERVEKAKNVREARGVARDELAIQKIALKTAHMELSEIIRHTPVEENGR